VEEDLSFGALPWRVCWINCDVSAEGILCMANKGLARRGSSGDRLMALGSEQSIFRQALLSIVIA
jgi:hypothetical protein